jgi:ribosomal protein S24E
MSSFFSWLSSSDAVALLPKVQVTLELYNRHGSLLAQPAFQKQISSLDEDVWLLLSLVYTNKTLSRKEIRSWIKQQEQMSPTVLVSVSDVSRVEKKNLDKVTVAQHNTIWLEAIGQWHIYKRTLHQDVEKLLN